MKNTFIIITLAATLINCKQARQSESNAQAGLHIQDTIAAKAETLPTPRDTEDDSADDPAIWVNYQSPEKSVIYGADKKGGIGSYTLNGEQISYDKANKINNIDVRQDIVLGTDTLSILAGSDRTDNSILIAKIDSTGKLDYQSTKPIPEIKEKEVYGFALGYDQEKKELTAYINTKQGEIFAFALNPLNKSEFDWAAHLKFTWKLPSKVEGMMIDDQQKKFYIGEEEKGIYKFDLQDTDQAPVLLANSTAENKNITYDIEGITLYPVTDSTGYIVASIQGNNSYALFRREGNNEYLKSFRIVDGVVDGVEETDGLDVTTHALGADYPAGILVVQDGFNYEGETKKSQNFKILDWREIEKLIEK